MYMIKVLYDNVLEGFVGYAQAIDDWQHAGLYKDKKTAKKDIETWQLLNSKLNKENKVTFEIVKEKDVWKEFNTHHHYFD